MKFIKTSLLLVATLFFSGHLFAQPSETICDTYTVVAKSCVGECANPGGLEYTVISPCNALLVPMCLSNVESDLCINQRAVATVYANGQIVAQGDITPIGSNLSFSVPCNSIVKVVVHSITAVPGVECIRLGNLKFVLSRG